MHCEVCDLSPTPTPTPTLNPQPLIHLPSSLLLASFLPRHFHPLALCYRVQVLQLRGRDSVMHCEVGEATSTLLYWTIEFKFCNLGDVILIVLCFVK